MLGVVKTCSVVVVVVVGGAGVDCVVGCGRRILGPFHFGDVNYIVGE